MTSVLPIRTERLLLRDFTRDDLARYAALRTHPDFLRHYSGHDAAPERSAELLEMFLRWAAEEPRRRYQLAVTLSDGTLVGSCGVRLESEGEASFGCELGRDYWGEGYAHEAARAIIACGFARLGLERIHASTRTGNTAAVALALRLGLRVVDEGEENTLLVLTREEWAMPDRVRLPLRFDPILLKRDLAQAEGMGWTDHFVTQNYSGSWSIIPLRAPAGESHPVRMIYPDPSCTEFVDTPILGECPYFREVLATFRCPIDAARLMKLDAGSAIKEHSDHDLALETGTVRLHVPVFTNPGVEFYLNGRRVVMKEGECWYLRLSDPHRVANTGATDRVHMVIDLKANEWLRGVMGT